MTTSATIGGSELTTGAVSLVGRRVAIDGLIATVRYQGPIHGKAGEWLGLEWDDVCRGKHSGEFQGRRYFATEQPGAGSFVAAAKTRVETGRTFLEALRERYLADQPADGKVALGSDGSTVAVETVGWDKIKRKQSKLETVSVVGLPAQMISTAGSDDDIELLRTLGASIEDLDLSRNLLESWSEVARLAGVLPSLESLRLSSSRLTIPDDGVLAPPDAFAKLRRVTLMNSLLTWDSVARIEPWLPNLEELHIGLNRISRIGSASSSDGSTLVCGFLNLQVLNLEGNCIDSWDEVLNLRRLPKLRSLNLPENKIAAITQLPKDTSEDASPFQHLTTLNLSTNLISEWVSVHALNSFPSLQDLRIKRNPVIDENDKNAFWIIIARVARVTMVSGSQLSARDRLNAELFYLNDCAQMIQSIQAGKPVRGGPKTMDEFERLNPRYPELCRIHGTPDVAPASITSNALKDRLLELHLVHVPTGKRISKRIPSTMNVRKLRALLIRLFAGGSGSVASLRIEWVRATKSGDAQESQQASSALSMAPGTGTLSTLVTANTNRQELDDDVKELQFYGVESGDTLEIFDQ
ncbi:hypothetical protein HK105_204220 [Polyrhizophydium stewartii]|uniref:CAP-Gly domain-containing protein n=1 Tax=Polyrhizophydium stewartii TaxID=2732419 RepID=A0ABR4N9J4_9FUNG|nr:hypothetical protein HK105_008270 [Polyrhizophydium stewartii]